MESFGKQLIAARKAAGLTQDQLAAQINVTRQAVSHWENDRSLPDVMTVLRLSQVLHCQFAGLSDAVSAPPDPDAAPQTAPDTDLPAPETQVPAPDGPEAEVLPDLPAPAVPAVPGRRLPGWLTHALAFAAGCILTCLVMLSLGPGAAPEAAAADQPFPRDEGLAHLSTQRNTPDFYRQADPCLKGRPYVTLVANADPVQVVRSDEFPDGLGWFYTVFINERNDVPFVMEEMILVELWNDRIMYEHHYDAETLAYWWGSPTLPAHSQRDFTGGMPLQPLDGIGLLLVGHDEQGNPMDFRGYFSLSQAE